MSDVTDGPTIRADAARNVERILDAGRQMLRSHGPSVPYYAIAKAAGVGQATLYRHFPNKMALVRAIVEENIDDLEQSTAAILASGGGFDDVLCELTTSVASHGAVSALLASESGTEWHGQVVERVVDILDRAAAGDDAVRADLDRSDLRLVLEMLGGALTADGGEHPDRSERVAHLLLEGLRVGGS